MMRYFAFNEEFGGLSEKSNDVPITQWLQFGLFAGFIVGGFYAIVEFFSDRFMSKRLTLGLVFLVKAFIYFISLVLSVSLISRLIENVIDRDLPNDEVGWWWDNKVFWLIVAYFIISSLVFSFLKIANEKFGKGVFMNLLIGKYKKPREEKRLLMFLDLQSSTTIAEELGHYKYSAFIQECFYDLNVVVNKHYAEIYQYVGDEAVLSWPFKNGIKNNNCLALFYHFEERLSKRKNIYLKQYGILPKLKAGIHGGNLIVTEVGSIKKEIAYHGDVINTTARIQSECNRYGEYLLVSKTVLDALDLSSNYQSQNLGDIILKGKEEAINIIAIRKN